MSQRPADAHPMTKGLTQTGEEMQVAEKSEHIVHICDVPMVRALDLLWASHPCPSSWLLQIHSAAFIKSPLILNSNQIAVFGLERYICK